MIKRRLIKSRIADDKTAEYIKIHDEASPALIEEYKKHGIKSLSCFVDGYDLYVYTEYDDSFDNIPTGDSMPEDAAIQKKLELVKDNTVPRRQIKEVFHFK